MSFVRASALSLLYPLFTITLFGFGLIFSVKMVLGTPQPVEQALTQSGIYNVMAKQVISDNQGNDSTSLPLQQPQVQAAVQQAFPPALLQQSVNQILNGTYTWLQGKNATPTFHVDLTGAKTNLANAVATYVQQRLDSLPACTLANLPADLNNINPYTLSCVPSTLDKTAVVQQVKQGVLNNTDLIDNPVITADTLKNGDGQTLTNQLRVIPRIYKDVLLGIYITGLVAVLTGVGIVLLHASRRAGLRHVAVTALLVGALSSGIAFLGAYVLTRASDNLAHNSRTTLIQSKLVQVIRLLADDLRHWWIGYGLGLILAGVITLVVLRTTKTRTPPTVLPQHVVDGGPPVALAG